MGWKFPLFSWYSILTSHFIFQSHFFTCKQTKKKTHFSPFRPGHLLANHRLFTFKSTVPTKPKNHRPPLRTTVSNPRRIPSFLFSLHRSNEFSISIVPLFIMVKEESPSMVPIFKGPLCPFLFYFWVYTTIVKDKF
jgi:hypothetical protein